MNEIISKGAIKRRLNWIEEIAKLGENFDSNSTHIAAKTKRRNFK